MSRPPKPLIERKRLMAARVYPWRPASPRQRRRNEGVEQLDARPDGKASDRASSSADGDCPCRVRLTPARLTKAVETGEALGEDAHEQRGGGGARAQEIPRGAPHGGA